MELEHPIRVEFCGYLTDTGGAGRYRGGVAVMRDFRLLAEKAAFQFRSERRKFLPWGLEGGSHGSASAIVLDPYGEARLLGEKGEIRIRRGEVVRTCQSGGGGYGNPLLRDPKLVWADVRDEFVSVQAARDDYGVVIDQTSGSLDEVATETLRAQKLSRKAIPTEPHFIHATQQDVEQVLTIESGRVCPRIQYSVPDRKWTKPRMRGTEGES